MRQIDDNRQPDNRQPEEIERDIQRTRDEVSSTIDAIQSKLTPGQMMDQALSYAKTSLPADFGSNLGQTVRENPVPVALIGVGIAWLMMSGQQGQHSRTQVYGGASRSDALNRSTTSPYDASFGAENSSYEYGEEHHEGSVRHAMGKVSGAGRDAKNRVSETGQHMKERISGTGQQMKERASHMRDRANELGHRSQENYYRAKDRFGQMLDEQPLVLGALGIALGASLGAAMPRTRREDEMMGSTRDRLMEQAKQRANEQAGKVQEVANKAMKEAKEDAGNSAGSPEVASNSARDMEEHPVLVETKGIQPVTTDGSGTGDDSRRQSLH